MGTLLKKSTPPMVFTISVLDYYFHQHLNESGLCKFLQEFNAIASGICGSRLVDWIFPRMARLDTIGTKRKLEEKHAVNEYDSLDPQFWTAAIPWTCPVCPVEMSRLSSGHSVQSMWNYTCSGWDVPGVLGLTPKPSPGHFQGRLANKFL